MNILFIFPNIDCGGYKPVGLTAVMNCCRSAGHEVNSGNLRVRCYKQIDRIISELSYLKKKYDLNFYRF